jgi:hypothetical protein
MAGCVSAFTMIPGGHNFHLHVRAIECPPPRSAPGRPPVMTKNWVKALEWTGAIPQAVGYAVARDPD